MSQEELEPWEESVLQRWVRSISALRRGKQESGCLAPDKALILAGLALCLATGRAEGHNAGR